MRELLSIKIYCLNFVRPQSLFHEQKIIKINTFYITVRKKIIRELNQIEVYVTLKYLIKTPYKFQVYSESVSLTKNSLKVKILNIFCEIMRDMNTLLSSRFGRKFISNAPCKSIYCLRIKPCEIYNLYHIRNNKIINYIREIEQI